MNLQEAVNRSTDELQRRLEEHRRLLNQVLGEGIGDIDTETCLLLDCVHRRRLRQLVVETVEVLEETRKAFKSRQLEVLRRKLLRTLAEEP